MRFLKKILKILSNRITLTVVAMAIQFTWFYLLILYLSDINQYFSWALTAVSFIIVLKILNNDINTSYKLIWTMLILLIPLAGILFYFVGGKSRVAKRFTNAEKEVRERQGHILKENPLVRQHIRERDQNISNQSWYLTHSADAPCYEDTETEYFKVGEDWFERFIQELRKAEHYIFLEYFIIAEGYMWHKVLEILREKAKEGVDVRIIYDGLGTMNGVPHKYYKTLQSYGIKCACFNPFRPILNLILNNRDHRKITVIDGNVAFCGGINLSDEYINRRMRFGHWKDSGICLHGEAVWNFTLMFLQMWAITTGVKEDFLQYRPNLVKKETFHTDGFVQPFGDSPLDNETVGENVYVNMIGAARNYVYVFTPYLVLDDEMIKALCNAAKRGVDVRIVTPGIPDKKLVYLLTQSYYKKLLQAGVRIFEYSPGFIHSKSMVADDEVAVVGTINLDYRSLYLHFECGVFLYHTRSVMQMKEDAMETFDVSRERTLEFCLNRNILVRGFQSILRVFAPLL